jgi:hypothetical protein
MSENEPTVVTIERAWFRLMQTIGQRNPDRYRAARSVLNATARLTRRG